MNNNYTEQKIAKCGNAFRSFRFNRNFAHKLNRNRNSFPKTTPAIVRHASYFSTERNWKAPPAKVIFRQKEIGRRHQLKTFSTDLKTITKSLNYCFTSEHFCFFFSERRVTFSLRRDFAFILRADLSRIGGYRAAFPSW